MGAWSTAVQAHAWEFNAAANGDDTKRKIFSQRAQEMGVHPEDFAFLMNKLLQPGKSLADAAFSQPSLPQIKSLAIEVTTICLNRAGKAVSSDSLMRCVSAASVGTIIFNWRFSGISRVDADRRFAEELSSIPDKAITGILEGITERVYGEGSVVNAFPEFMRPNVGQWVAYDEFGRCVAASAR